LPSKIEALGSIPSTKNNKLINKCEVNQVVHLIVMHIMYDIHQLKNKKNKVGVMASVILAAQEVEKEGSWVKVSQGQKLVRLPSQPTTGHGGTPSYLGSLNRMIKVQGGPGKKHEKVLQKKLKIKAK
jgi:hypothetical protein